MTDDLMDARLRAAGEKWRTANTSSVDVPSEPAEELVIGPRGPRRSRWITAASAAVVAAALVVGGAVLVNNSRDNGGKPASVEATNALTSQTWVLSDAPATLTFAHDTMTLDDGCNIVTRHVQIAGNHLTFGSQLGRTSGCSRPGDRVQQIESILSGTVTWSVRDDSLTVRKTDSTTIGVLTFTSAQAQLAGTWTLVGPGTADRVTLLFKGDTVRSDDGCTKATYAVRVDGNQLTLGAPIGAVTTCTGPPTANVAGIGSGTVTWSVTANKLTITKQGVGTLVYQHVAATNDTPLTDTTWQLTEIVDKDNTQLAPVGTPNFTISADNHVAGSDGCNTFSGDVRVASGAIDFGQLAITEMACTDAGAMDTAGQVDAILTGTVDYAISADQLTLTKKGVGTLRYKALPSISPSVNTVITNTWLLTGTEVTSASGNSSSGSGSSAVGKSVLTFDGNGGFTLRHTCYTLDGKVTVADGTLEFDQVPTRVAVPCPSNAESKAGQDENDFVDFLLTNKVTWTIDGSGLKIADSRHAATFAAATGVDALVSPKWTLATIAHGSDANSPVSSAPPVVFQFAPDGVSDSDDNAASAAVTAGTIRLTSAWINGLVGHAGEPGLDLADSKFVYEKLLIGTVSWSIGGGKLVITHAGVGTLVFTRS
jgi:heat shock protein HslJ